ncbi:lipopolysaccharide biosynthesis protein [Ahrensia marina]|uniref:Multi antimicrobial extrusion protein MatE n=1 Tax=Ahrensia marina TaxID=1514904 RepID=A0A0N0VL13_9HYPH|nr:lipopolysaccharide biosynthesis protein [Ahrensia marina]KPB00261.1 multi antimicrobial extrusion protein MatE [Ahrensia marina]
MRFSAVQTAETFFPTSLFARLRPFAERLDVALSGVDDASNAQRASIIAFAIRIFSAAIAFVSQVVLARFMGAFEYGIFVMVWISMIVIGNLSCLGFHTAIIRFLPQYHGRADFERLNGLLLSSRVFVLLSSTIAAAATIFTTIYGAAYFDSHYTVPFIVGAFALPMIALGDMLDGTARANSWPIRALAPTYLLRPIFILVLMVGAWLMGYPVNGVTGLICAVIASYCSSLIQYFVITRDLRRQYKKAKPRIEMRQWILVALPIFLVEGFFALLVHADVFMVGIMMNPESVGIYYAAAKTLSLVHFVFFAVKAGIANLFAARMEDEDKSALRQLARRSATWTFWPSLAMGIAVLAAGPLLLSMFGTAFREGYPVLFIMVAGVVLRASIGPAESLLNMSGNQNICAIIFGGVLASNIVLNLILIPEYGIYGAAAATAIATVFETIALFYFVRMRVGVSMFVFSPVFDERVS